MTAPGTGLLEVLAFALLIFAGYQIANQPFNLWALILLVVGVFPFVYAVRKSGKWYYLLAATLTFIIGSVFLFSSDTWWRPVVNPFPGNLHFHPGGRILLACDSQRIGSLEQATIP